MLVACTVGAATAILAGCGSGSQVRTELLVRSDRDGDLALYALATSGVPRRIVGLPLGVGPVSVSGGRAAVLVDGPRLEVLTSTGKPVAVLGAAPSRTGSSTRRSHRTDRASCIRATAGW